MSPTTPRQATPRRPAAAVALLVAAAAVAAVLAVLAPGVSTAAAGKPAPAVVALKADLSGRVSSDRAACEKQRPVYLLGHAPDGSVTSYGFTTTDDRGRFSREPSRRADADASAVVVATKRCRVAQSRSVTPLLAARLAPRRVSFEATVSSLSGRVSSARPGCVRRADVVFFLRQEGDRRFLPFVSARTDRKGRYSYGVPTRLGGGTTADLFALVLGDDACAVAQSPTRTLTIPTQP